MSFTINRVYTRSGDKGETSLIDGSRVSKAHPRCACFGGLDEISCHLGLAKDSLPKDDKLSILKQVIEYIQQELFDLGAELATPAGFSYPEMWKVKEENIINLEKLCDYFNQDLPELKSFILPGGDVSASHLHVARSVTRRVERDIVKFYQDDNSSISVYAIQYINRLSDLLFILSRYILSQLSKPVPLWVKDRERVFPIK